MRHATILVLVGLLAIPLQGCSLLFGHVYRARTTFSSQVDHVVGAGLTVKTRNGGVEVVASPDATEVSVTARLTCGGDTQEEADARLAAATVSVTRAVDRRLRIEPVFPGGPRSGDGASIVVGLPDATGVYLDTSNGSVVDSGLATLRGVASVRVRLGLAAAVVRWLRIGGTRRDAEGTQKQQRPSEQAAS